LSPEEIALSLSAADDVRKMLPKGALAFVDTYGCQQNEADSERIRGMLASCGCEFTDSADNADIVVINTCSVREHAEAKVFGVIGALLPIKKNRPEMIICVCGCMAQRPGAAERLRTAYRHVDIVFGTHALYRLPVMLREALSARTRVFDTEDSDGVIAEGLPSHRDGKYKGWLSIMYGCNNYCSYCIVPYVRGRERSRRPDVIISDFAALLDDGVRDITLLGQNVNSYGSGLDEVIDFPELLHRLDNFKGEYRIRFMTSHPKDASDRLFQVMSDSRHIAKCLHLPFQSGSSRVLELMNRKYTREAYLVRVERVRKLIPDIVLTSDVIVGFPGETLEDFEQTMSLIEDVRYDALFTFIYSPRPGAPSYLTENNTPRDEIQRRFDMLVARQNEISEEKHAAYVGRTMRVLIDGTANDPVFPYTSRTSGNRLVRLKTGKPGTFTDVRITSATRWSLTGEPISKD